MFTMFTATFQLGHFCLITVILEDWKMNLINICASNHCFSYWNIFQNGVNAVSKADDTLSTKSWKSDNVQIVQACGIYITELQMGKSLISNVTFLLLYIINSYNIMHASKGLVLSP